MMAGGYAGRALVSVACAAAVGLLLAPDPVSAAPSIAATSARLRALNKQTGRASDIEIPVGEARMFENIAVEVKACYSAPDFETPENAVFARVLESSTNARQAADAIRGKQIFSGWMFSSSPSLSALEHPNYDIWLLECGK